jgi:hypothetical protein
MQYILSTTAPIDIIVNTDNNTIVSINVHTDKMEEYTIANEETGEQVNPSQEELVNIDNIVSQLK